MVRDFTEATKERLLKEIDDINKNTWNPVTDFIGDLFLRAGKWMGVLALKENMSNVESYQRAVLDMTDMTKKELKEIFEKVYDIDKDYAEKFSRLNEREETYNAKLQKLYSAIQPDFCIPDAKTIGSMVSDYNDRLKSIDGKITKDFEKELDWAAGEAALESVKGFFGSALKTVVDVVTLPVSMVKNVVTENWGGIFSDTWSLIDDVFSVGGNLVGITALGLGYGISALNGSNETKHEAIAYSEAYGGAGGLTDILEAEQKVNGEDEFTSLLIKGSKATDSASALVGLASDAKGFYDDPSSMIDTKFGLKGEIKLDNGKLRYIEKYKLSKADMAEKYQKDYRHWQALYRHLGKSSHSVLLKDISNGYKYMESLWELPDGVENVVENVAETAFNSFNRWFKSWGNAWELGEDVYDFVAG